MFKKHQLELSNKFDKLDVSFSLSFIQFDYARLNRTVLNNYLINNCQFRILDSSSAVSNKINNIVNELVNENVIIEFSVI